MKSKYLFTFSIISFLLFTPLEILLVCVSPPFSESLTGFTTIIPYSSAQEIAPKAPETLEEAKELGERMLKAFPEALKKPWQEAVVIWKRMWVWFKNLGYSIWYRINSFLGREVEKRKPEIQEEFEKEKQEMKEEIPKVGKSLWQRFKELIY